MAAIQTRIESARGCGYKKKGGLYLVSAGAGKECDKLPVPLVVCKHCGGGIKFSRGFTWITGDLFDDFPCRFENELFSECEHCPLNIKATAATKMGLLWVGEKFYSSPQDFVRESLSIGISRRIAQVPKDLKIGETWVCFAHRKAISSVSEKGQIIQTPGIFYAFIPQRIEYVVTGQETEEELNAKEARGFTLINVIPDTDAQTTLHLDDDVEE